MSRIARGVVVVSVVMSLAAPVQARPDREDVGRGKRDIVKIVQKWMASIFGAVQSTGDGLVDPWPKP
ncbi:MAG TPA: hypothetical protein VF111_07145 [Thermoanaerobaculia bacterium]